MRTVTVEITVSDIQLLAGAGARMAERALRRAGFIGLVDSHWIRLYDAASRSWQEVETPGQLRRFMRLVEGGCHVPPPTLTISVPEPRQEAGLPARACT